MILALSLRWCAVTLAAAALAWVSLKMPARAQSLRDLKCTGNPDVPWAEQVAGCTQAIGSGRFSGTGLAQLLNNRGNAYMGTGDLDHALADFDRAISLAPDSAVPHNGRGIAYAAKNDFDHALADFTEAIRLAPSYALAFNNRGLLYARHQNFDRAIADYDEAIRLKPDYDNAYINRGNVYAAEKNVDRAIADYTAAIGIDPKIAAAYDFRAMEYSRQGRPRPLACRLHHRDRAQRQPFPFLHWPRPCLFPERR